MPQQTKQPFVTGSAFKLNNNAAYLPWREERMGADKPVLSDLLVQINNPYQLSDDEKLAIIERCAVCKLPGTGVVSSVGMT